MMNSIASFFGGGGTPVNPSQAPKTSRTPVTKRRKIVPGSGMGIPLSEGEERSSNPDYEASGEEEREYDHDQEYEDDRESVHSSFHDRLSQAAGAVGNALLDAGNILVGATAGATGGGSRRPSHASTIVSTTTREARAAARTELQLAAENAARQLAAHEAAEEAEYQEDLRRQREERRESERRIDEIHQRRHEERVRLENERLYKLHEDNRPVQEIDSVELQHEVNETLHRGEQRRLADLEAKRVEQEAKRLEEAQMLPKTTKGFPSMAALMPELPKVAETVLIQVPLPQEDQEMLDIQAQETEYAIAQLQNQIDINEYRQSRTQVRTTTPETGTFLYLKKKEKTQKGVVSRFVTALHKRTNDKAYLEGFGEKIDEALEELFEIKNALVNTPGLTAVEAQELEYMFKDYEKKTQGAKQNAQEFLAKIRELDQINKGAKQKQPAGQAKSTRPTEMNVPTRTPFPSGPVAQTNIPVPTGPMFQTAPATRPPIHPSHSDSSDSRQPGGKRQRKGTKGKKKTRFEDEEAMLRKWKETEDKIAESRWKEAEAKIAEAKKKEAEEHLRRLREQTEQARQSAPSQDARQTHSTQDVRGAGQTTHTNQPSRENAPNLLTGPSCVKTGGSPRSNPQSNPASNPRPNPNLNPGPRQSPAPTQYTAPPPNPMPTQTFAPHQTRPEFQPYPEFENMGYHTNYNPSQPQHYSPPMQEQAQTYDPRYNYYGPQPGSQYTHQNYQNMYPPQSTPMPQARRNMASPNQSTVYPPPQQGDDRQGRPRSDYQQAQTRPTQENIRIAPVSNNPPNPPVDVTYMPPGISWTGENERGYTMRPERPILKLELKDFDGGRNGETWLRFKHNFGAVVGSKNYDDGTKCFQLLNALKGEPLRIAEALTLDDYNTDTYRQVWNTLEENYGGVYRLRNTIYARIERFPKIKKLDKNNTLELENLLKAIQNTFSNSRGIIDEGGVINTQVKRLIPEQELASYFLQVARDCRTDTLQEFYKFIAAQRVAYKLADTHQKEETHRSHVTRTEGEDTVSEFEHPEEQVQYESHAAFTPNKSHGKPKTDNVPPSAPAYSKPYVKPSSPETKSDKPTEKTPIKCSYCKELHMLYKCPTFKILSVSSKYDHIKSSRSCIHCLNEGHMLRDCVFYPERKCGAENCDRLHHRTLHNFKEKNGRTLLSIEEIFEQEQILASYTTGFGEANDEYVAIRTTTALVSCGGKVRRVVIAMDPCSNSTNIDEDFAHEMGLKVEKTGIIRNISFMESSAKITSDVVSFCLSSLEGQAMYPVQAYTVKNLIRGTPVIDWNLVAEDYPHLNDAKIPLALDTDRVHILLGTDFAYLNGSSECISNDANEPIAEKTKLGWAFSGRIKSKNIMQSWRTKFARTVSFTFCSFMTNELDIDHVIQKDLIRTEELVNECQDLQTDLTEKELTEDIEPQQVRTEITAAMLDLAVVACVEPNPGLFTYLQMQPSEEEREKLLELDEIVRKSWEIEALGLVERIPLVSNNLDKQTSDGWSKSEKLAVERMDLKYLPDLKQFQMAIPWKDDPPKFMKSNRAEVKLRQDGVCKRLGDKMDAARKIFDDYLAKNYIRKLSPQEIYEQNVFYLPFFTVIKEDSTTPVRIVWDCAAKYFGRSLNSEIMATPNCLQPLFTVLLRVRKFPFVVMSDISEMFLKVKLDPKDRRYHRFVFDGQDYEWTSILFGNRSSPDGSQLAIQRNCEMFGENLPEALETVKKSLYMDDGADSRETEELALKLATELVELFSYCSMPVHKFFSNSDLVCQTLDKKTLAKQISFTDASDTIWDSGKVLGMIYAVDEGDVFTFSSKFRNANELVTVKNGKWTKRNVCSASASIFDPLGLISPFVVRARVIMQEIWRQKLDWDQPLPNKVQEAWLEWLNQVFVVPDIKIRRWSGMKTKSSSYQIHTFCDASEEGYAVAVYIRVKIGKEITTNLLTAKSRVSPLKAESISRQELVACVLAVRLTSAVQETYPASVDNTFYWTDSEVCLVWINRTAKSFKAFVAHRVGEIHTHTEPRQWLHVPTAQNPADIGTRSITALELKDCRLWWEGPEFLKLPVTEWPKTKVVQQIDNLELKQTVFLTTEPFKKASFSDSLKKLHPSHFSVGKHYNGYIRCVRRWAMVQKALLKFKQSLHLPRVSGVQETLKKTEKSRLTDDPKTEDGNKSTISTSLDLTTEFCQMACDVSDKKSVTLTPDDIQMGKNFLIRQAQLEFFEQEIKLMSIDYKSLVQVASRMKTDILQFNPYLDEFGIMRSKSRLSEVGRDYESSHPIILHRHSDLTRLIACSIHFEFDHPVSFAAMKAALRKHYAIIGLGTLCTQIRSHCTLCKKLRAGVVVQQMAPLPERRVGSQLRAFEHVGLDFAGPFELKVGRARARKKVWILVLTCMVVRAVHFEVTGGLDTTCVINALSRFCDVRGIPETLTSDNQSSFHKADDELVEWYASIDWERVVMETSFGFKPFSKGILWIFNPPVAPHFGGIFETMVKACKRAMKATIGHADLNEEEFRTVVSKMSHLLNCRPIQLVSDRDDYETLTPNHFLLPGLAGAVFPPDVDEKDRLKLPVRLRHQIMVQRHVWKRFQAEIIPMLGPRKKWCAESPNLKENDVVMEFDDNLPRGVWRLLRVSKIIPSIDGLVRKVEVINATGKTYSRPISRLIPIARE